MHGVSGKPPRDSKTPHGNRVQDPAYQKARKRRQNILLTLWICFPVVAFSGILWFVAYGLSQDPAMDNTRPGVGSGSTGGANFLGQRIFGSGRDQNQDADPDADPAEASEEPQDPEGQPVDLQTPEDRGEAPGGGDVQPELSQGRLAPISIPAIGHAADAGRHGGISLVAWLPPGYDDAGAVDRVFPVLYMHDARILFDGLSAGDSAGDPQRAAPAWGFDTIASRLITLGLVEPFVIVGISHEGDHRYADLDPVGVFGSGDRGGLLYADWFVHEMLPAVEGSLRVSREPGGRVIGGAGFGAAISVAITMEHPGAFGGLYIESMPTLAGAGDAWRSRLAGAMQWPDRVFVGMGGREASIRPEDEALNRVYSRWARELDTMLMRAGLGADRRMLVFDAEASFGVAAWRRRLPDAMQFLFSPATGDFLAP